MTSQAAQRAHHVVVFVIPPADPTMLFSQSVQPDGSKTPLHAIKLSKDSKPQVQIAAFAPSADGIGSQVPIGSATMSSLSSSIELQLHGNSMKMKSDLGSGHDFTFPPTGKLKWKSSGLSTSKLKLVDGAGTTIATYSKGSLFGGDDRAPKMEAWVQCVPQFLDLVVLSGLALARHNERNNEIGLEILQAVGGAGA